MTPVVQALHTSADHVRALKDVDKIKKAISLVEGGDSVVDFPRYIKAYTSWAERAVATTDLGHSTNPHLRTAHQKLTQELHGLEKRLRAASVKMGIAPPSKELIQMLKLNDAPPAKTPATPPSKKSAHQWTWNRIGKYTVGTALALAIIANHPRESLKVVTHLPYTSFKLASEAVTTLNSAAEAAITTAATAQTVVDYAAPVLLPVAIYGGAYLLHETIHNQKIVSGMIGMSETHYGRALLAGATIFSLYRYVPVLPSFISSTTTSTISVAATALASVLVKRGILRIPFQRGFAQASGALATSGAMAAEELAALATGVALATSGAMATEGTLATGSS